MDVFGIRTTIKRMKKTGTVTFKGGKTYDTKETFRLSVDTRDIEEFKNKIGFSVSYKNKRLDKLLSMRKTIKSQKNPVVILSIESQAAEPTYNLTEPINNLVYANGVLIAQCSEFFAVDNSSCNLASLNLLKYYDGEEMQWDTMKQDIATLITAMDIIVDNAEYPTKEIEEMTRKTRPLGLGFANLGALLMHKLLPYDSNEARTFASEIMRRISTYAYRASSDLADQLGSFEVFEENKERCMEIASRVTADRGIVTDIENMGLRNSQLTLLAPTGTIGFAMGCDTQGVEPLFDLEILKTLSDGSTINIIPDCVAEAVRVLRIRYKYQEGTTNREVIEDCKSEKVEHALGRGVFDTSNEISWKGHIDMVAAVQKKLNMGISKTINMPNDATVEDVWDAYMYAWKSGLKCISIYRDGSKHNQPLTAKKEKKVEPKCEAPQIGPPKSVRNKLPDTRPAKIHKFDVGGMEGYLIPGVYEDGSFGELFIKAVKQGSGTEGLLDAFATALSYAVQHGVPLRSLVDKFKDYRFEPAGWTTNNQIPVCTSIIDYIAKFLEKEFLDKPDLIDAVLESKAEPEASTSITYDGDLCNICGAPTQRTGTCKVCTGCGTMLGGCSG